MSDSSKTPARTLHRRSVMQQLSLAAGGAAALTLTGFRAEAAAADDGKMTKSAAAYQLSPQGAQACFSCGLFAPPAACRVVAGNISPGGWCKLYVKKSA